MGQGLSRPEQIIERVTHAQAEKYGRIVNLDLSISNAVLHIQDVYLEKIVEELVDNAFKFSPEGANVRVAGLRDKDFYVLEVTDEGRGMTEEQVQRGGAFVQFDRNQFEQQGLGLGLTIARRLVELHGGTFDVESTPEAGTTVWVWFPLAE